ncbi:UDP-N-acetylmuramoyl-tripeptide--D-alanyl-D-alanine ligase [Loigolactobacillus jiayinensis]|uniref:UDP-N-acetylmuramoyl-tripeptide--D-alanyl-D-alanine ligase n=1 Tax=Loigolactobacillus jiayinensis TaxID=2486016 RepID=A0ABW1RIR0_9LACO|nr:UDP-N-acetylmuramoyl-tripeptide--D-alanyl-D-alanine ligase [Loigolactobacillus jiayinensis]
MKMQLAEIAQAVAAENDYSRWQDLEITSVHFDSRKLTTGALFVPLTAENDGHDYIGNAQQNGAVAAFWQLGHPGKPTDFPVLEVRDPLKALQQLAKYYLNKVDPRVIAITGSDGKTTTKDMTAAILAPHTNIVKTQGNFNNEIGVPITILNMSTNTETLVIEMGMDRPGQLDFLSQLVAPDLAIITMIGEAHIEFFGTRDKIADAKMEITHGLKEDGMLIYNGDEPLLQARAAKIAQRTKTFGQQESNDLYPTAIKAGSKQIDFTLNQYPETEFHLPLLGTYNVNNAMAAITIGGLFQVQPQQMQAALADFKLIKNRTQWVTGAQGEQILSDVYNANPTAMMAVLRAFSAVTVTGRHIVVLGDMLELGEQAPALHAAVAPAIDPAKINEVYLLGPQIQSLATILSKNPAFSGHVHYYPLNKKLTMITDLLATITAADAVLLKASNGIHLDEVLHALQTND